MAAAKKQKDVASDDKVKVWTRDANDNVIELELDGFKRVRVCLPDASNIEIREEDGVASNKFNVTRKFKVEEWEAAHLFARGWFQVINGFGDVIHEMASLGS